MGVDVTDAITPSPSPAGTAVRKLRNSPARAATQAYSATRLRTSPVGRALRTAHVHAGSRAALLQPACDRLRSPGAPCTSVYAYMRDGGELALEAFSGRETEHTRIPVGRGVCGTAVAT